jgi:hypothetical protein
MFNFLLLICFYTISLFSEEHLNYSIINYLILSFSKNDHLWLLWNASIETNFAAHNR